MLSFRGLSLGRGMPVSLVGLGVVASAMGVLAVPSAQAVSGQVYVYPKAPTGSVTDTYFDTTVADPYRWLEDSSNSQAQAWISGQADLTRRYLDTLPSRKSRLRQMDTLADIPVWQPPIQVDGRTFWLEQPVDVAQPRLMWSEAKGDPRVLIDPTTIKGAGPVSIAEWSVSPDGKLVAWAASESGSDWRTIRVIKVSDGTFLPEAIPHARFTEIWWSSDGQGFAYQAYPAPAEFSAAAAGAQLRYHRLGTPVEDDTVLMARPDHPRDYFWVCCQESTGKVLMAIGPQQITYSWIPNLGPNAAATELFTVPVSPLPQMFYVGEGFLLIREYQGAERGRIMRIDLANPNPTQWATIVDEGADNLVGASVVGGRILLTYLQNASARLRMVEMDGSPVAWVDLPGLGSIGPVLGSASQPVASFTYSSFTQPPEVLQVDTRSGAVRTWRSPRLTFDPRQFITSSVMVPSKDGTPVHAFIVRRRDVTRSGDNPTLLWGYGGFNIAMKPEYRAEWLAWIQHGGVFVYANLRGGGEYGREWYLAGTKLRKQNVFDDFIAIAEWLKVRRWTDRARLAITGRSNGGLLVGAVMTQRPDLAAAAVPQVGVLDMLRYQNFTVGASWARDYGRSDDSPEMFAALYAYSPLHNVRSGVRYPATLITTAESDDRVVPAHSYKFAAALQAANASTKPILIRIERGAGHGPGASSDQMIAQQADLLSFLDVNLGVAPVVPNPVFMPASPQVPSIHG